MQAYIRKVGAAAAARIFTQTLVSKLAACGATKLAFGLGAFINIVINKLDIGTRAARWLDSKDPRPNNCWLTI